MTKKRFYGLRRELFTKLIAISKKDGTYSHKLTRCVYRNESKPNLDIFGGSYEKCWESFKPLRDSLELR